MHFCCATNDYVASSAVATGRTSVVFGCSLSPSRTKLSVNILQCNVCDLRGNVTEVITTHSNDRFSSDSHEYIPRRKNVNANVITTDYDTNNNSFAHRATSTQTVERNFSNIDGFLTVLLLSTITRSAAKPLSKNH